MTNEITKSTFSMPSTQEMDQLNSMCKVMAQAPFYQKLGPGGVMAIYLSARELNLPFMACLNGGMYTFDGKVTLSTQLMNMMIVNAGHKANVIELNEKICRILFWRCDRKEGENDTFEYVYTIEQAEKAGYLRKDNWKLHPRDMLFARCLSGGARKFMPDTLMNCYVHGEIEEEKPIVKPEDVKPLDTDQSMIFTCQKCNKTDITLRSKAKEWECPHCKFNDVKLLDNDQSVTNCNLLESDVKPEIARPEDVDTLISLLPKCPQNFQDNFKNITEKNYGDAYNMSPTYCEKCTFKALELIKGSSNANS